MENQSDLNLANAALNHLGAEKIPSLDDTVNSKTIQAVRLYLPLAKQVTLRARDWNSVRGRITLAALDANALSLGEWSAAYRVPSDLLCMRRFVSTSNYIKFAAYSIEIDEDGKRVLFTNLGSNKIVYTRNITDVNRWDSLLFETCWFRLAAYLAGPIVRDFKLGQSMVAMWTASNEEAIGVDEGEGRLDQVYDSTLVSVRYW